MLHTLKLSTLRTHPEYLEIRNARAVDGDTVQADIVLPLGVTIRKRIRLKHFLAPEPHGANPAAGERARVCLQNALDVHECHIQCHGMKEDRYGRIAAVLLLNGRATHGGLVLGGLQLTPAAHKHDLDVARGRVSEGDSLSS